MDGSPHVGKAVRLHVSRWARRLALWFVLLLPLSPSVWRLYAMGPACFTPAWTAQGVQPADCLTMFATVAPFAVIFGPIAHEEDEDPSEVPDVLLTALLLAVLATVLSTLFRSLRPNKP